MAKKPRTLPPLPKFVTSVLGPVPVHLVEGLVEVRKHYGETDFPYRTISIDSGMDPVVSWQTYWHEAFHILLFDAGLRDQVDIQTEETLCDAFGTYMTRALQEGHLVVPAAQALAALETTDA